jgi:hypothetical protein
MRPLRSNFFPKPYPERSAGWSDLTFDQQELWRQWSLGNPVTDTDFRNVIRATPNAYAIVAPNAAAERFDPINPAFPPPPPSWHPGLIAPNLTSVNAAPSAQLYLTAESTGLSFWSVWTTPFYPVGASPALQSLKWVSSVRVEPDEGPGLAADDFGTQLAAAIGPLDGHVGDFLVLFVFEGSNGQLRYVGAQRLQVEAAP